MSVARTRLITCVFQDRLCNSLQDFCTDIITIETADHARLQLQLSYNWHFDVDTANLEDAAKLFSVPDFVGDLCKGLT